VPCYPKLEKYQLDYEAPSLRLEKHMHDYVMSHVWAVCRREPWSLAARTYASKEFNLFCQAELQFEIILSFAGKSKVLRELMWLRSIDENPPIANTEPSLDSSSPLNVFWKDDTRRAEKSEFIDTVSYALQTLGVTRVKNLKMAVVDACESYISFLEVYNKSSNHRSLMTYVPESVKTLCRPIFSFRERNYPTLQRAATGLVARGIQVNFQDLSLIEKSIVDFYSDVPSNGHGYW
jgi:hypothetical protein